MRGREEARKEEIKLEKVKVGVRREEEGVERREGGGREEEKMCEVLYLGQEGID